MGSASRWPWVAGYLRPLGVTEPPCPMKRILIFAGILLAVGIALAQFALRPSVTEVAAAPLTEQTTGVVKSLRDPPLFSSSPLQRATVALSDGSLVDA